MESSITNKQKGFAMLFTILLVSLILSIAVSISNITLKQAVLSGLAKDSGIAFYQADAAVECGMQQDVALGNYPKGTTISTPNFMCGSTMMQMTSSPTVDKYMYTPVSVPGNKPCFTITFDKSNADGLSRVDGSGFNLCGQNPRRVERTLEVKY